MLLDPDCYILQQFLVSAKWLLIRLQVLLLQLQSLEEEIDGESWLQLSLVVSLKAPETTAGYESPERCEATGGGATDSRLANHNSNK